MIKINKIILLILISLILVSQVLGIQECQRKQSIKNIPCNIISSYHPTGSCSNYNITIFNNNGTLIQTKQYGEYNPFCNVTFDITEEGTYIYNGTLENGVISLEENTMEILLFFGLAFALIFIVLAIWMKDITLAALSGMLFIVLGVFLLINGFAGLNNLLSNSLGIVSIGVGAYIWLKVYIEQGY